MKLAHERAENTGSEWHESLIDALDLGLPSIFNIERLIDAAEQGEWGGAWW